MKEIEKKVEIGMKISNQQLTELFKCSSIGGMRRSHKTNSLVLIFDENNITHGMKKDIDGTYLFMGMGQEGNQSVSYAQNRTVYYSNINDINLYLFKKQKKAYEYFGRVLLGEEPRKVREENSNRDVLLFRLVPIGRSMDIRIFLTEYTPNELVENNIFNLNRKMLGKDSVNPIINLMKKVKIDTLLGPGGWFLSSKGYYFNNNIGTKNHYGKLTSRNDLKYVFKEQNTIINPFYTKSINYSLDKNKNINIVNQSEIKREVFKLLSLEIKSKAINNLDISFVDINKKYNNEFPFISLIIGANGTRKSTILSFIQKIFNEMYSFSIGKDKNIEILTADFFRLKYKIGNNEYTIVGEGKKRYFLLDENEISFDRLTLPNKTIVSTHSINDRFTYKSDPSIIEKSNYEYLGMRTTKTQVNINKLSERVFLNILKSLIEENFLNDLKILTDFLELDPYLKLNIRIEPKFRNLTRNIDSYNDKQISEMKLTYQELIDLNNLIKYDSNKYDFIQLNKNSMSITINLENNRQYEKQVDVFYSLINFIKKKVLTFDSLMVKRGGFFNIESASSGENHFFVTMTNLISRIQYSSLILIDEPEISLHPNWQIKYIRALRKIFRKYYTCHFIMATHSHFLVSDLTPADSSIVSLQNIDNDSKNTLYHKETFGWSAENILYSVFNVKTPRNYYIELELTELLGLISNKSQDFSRINEIINKIGSLPLEDKDPTNVILSQARRYIKNAEAK